MFKLLTPFIGLLTLLTLQSVAQTSNLSTQELEGLTDLYEHLHANPELSFLEKETSARMAQELANLGYTVTSEVGGYGVVGVLENGPGPTILVRADMDALPVLEATGLPYASTVRATDITGEDVPVMHACGHDIHMTVWVGTAQRMAANLDLWSGTLVFMGQPAEERSGGAKAMLADGLYSRFPTPDYCLAIHTSADLPAGTIGLCPGYAMANVDMVDIDVFGSGGHGAAPHTTKDPVVLSARMIMAMQTIVAREINPLEPAVLTVGSIQGGTKGNIIPNQVQLRLTLRSYSDEVRNALIEKIRRVCQGVAISAGIPEDKYPVVTVLDEYTPSLKNDDALGKRMEAVFTETLGADRVVTTTPRMVGEDFGRLGRTEEQVPIFLYWLGSVDPQVYAQALENGEQLPSLHSAEFKPLPKPTIETGVQSMTAILQDLLTK
ncbi:MAG: amidohydrolase [Bacteroidota bacterium]